MESISSDSTHIHSSIESSSSASELSVNSATSAENETYATPSTPSFSDISINDDNCPEDNYPICESQQEMEHDSCSSTLVLGYKLVGDNIDKNIKPRYS